MIPLILVAQPARANDTEAVLAGGVLTFKKSDGITMDSEELTISPFKVESRTWEALETETERKKYWLEKTNVVPTQDLKIAFIRYND